MKKITELAQALVHDESGQDLIEYALVTALIGLGAITAMHGLATSIGNAYSSLSSRVSTAM